MLLAFAAFGVFWGTWGGAIPAVQAHARVGDATMGGALLLIGLGALVSMRFTGHLLDRFGRSVVAGVVLAFGGCGIAAGLQDSAAALSAALFGLGATSGAFDVLINTAASTYEGETGRPVVSMAHAAFSVAVVAASVLTGVARSAGVTTPTIFAAAAALICAATIPMRSLHVKAVSAAVQGTLRPTVSRRWRVPGRLMALGLLCALANVIESAHQSWSARQLEAVLSAPPHIGALGPALFALATATMRLVNHRLAHNRTPPRMTLAAGAWLAAIGTATVALAPTVVLGLVGLAIAGLGVGVCAPTIISCAGARHPMVKLEQRCPRS